MIVVIHPYAANEEKRKKEIKLIANSTNYYDINQTFSKSFYSEGKIYQ